MHTAPPNSQRGAALVTALVFLIVITLLSLSSMRSSTLEMRMADNEQVRMVALERAQALIDSTVSTPANAAVIGAVGDMTCTVVPPANTTPTNPGMCPGANHKRNILLHADFQPQLADGDVHVVVTRTAPLVGNAPRGLRTSAAVFGAARFTVQGIYDRRDDGEGYGQITEGLMVLIPKGV